MIRFAVLVTLFAGGCQAEDVPADLASRIDLAMGDLSASRCLPWTPRTELTEGPCAIAPPNGYCLIDFPDPQF